MFLSEMRKQASSYLQDKYKTAKLALTDVTPAELLTEEATNNEPWGPDAKTMTKISEAAFDEEDYWRIVDVLHRRLRTLNQREWRQSYKALVLLEFLITHGPEETCDEFHCNINVIQEFGYLNHTDEKGSFNWGACMKSKSERILELLHDKEKLREARDKALKISKEIRGFGNLIVSPSSSKSRTSSFGSCSSGSPKFNEEFDEHNTTHGKKETQERSTLKLDKMLKGLHLWEQHPFSEKHSLLESTKEDEDEIEDEDDGLDVRHGGFHSRLMRFRSISNLGRGAKKKVVRQMSLGI